LGSKSVAITCSEKVRIYERSPIEDKISFKLTEEANFMNELDILVVTKFGVEVKSLHLDTMKLSIISNGLLSDNPLDMILGTPYRVRDKLYILALQTPKACWYIYSVNLRNGSYSIRQTKASLKISNRL
jgi:hypothetical protein